VGRGIGARNRRKEEQTFQSVLRNDSKRGGIPAVKDHASDFHGLGVVDIDKGDERLSACVEDIEVVLDPTLRAVPACNI
jgi:hypothetical protein